MGLEGLQAVQTRIAELQTRIGALSTTAPAGARPSVGATGAASFDQVLSGVMSTTGTSATGELKSATVRAPGQYGRLQPPPELAGYGNGRIPEDRLVPIGDGSERLHAPAANAFQAMAADAARAGVDLQVSDGYRSFDGQQAIAREVGLYRNGGRAAEPGTSTHGWGQSLDIDTGGGAGAWLRANAARYGFVEDVAREPWHWTYRPDGG